MSTENMPKMATDIGIENKDDLDAKLEDLYQSLNGKFRLEVNQ